MEFLKAVDVVILIYSYISVKTNKNKKKLLRLEKTFWL